tara:strand:- start:2186 stop:2821 length:636 start_codon:yes stop_codon:yes gene_type:complete
LDLILNKMSEYDLENFGYIIDNVPYPLIVKLKEIIAEKELEKTNHDLAGNIKKEFLIPKARPIFQEYLYGLVDKYEKKYSYLATINFLNDNVPLVLDTMWVNFQEKHEFNPAHTHSGVFSFALWLQVPYLIEEEKAKGPGKESNTNVPGFFQFITSTSLGNIVIKDIPVDKRWEGKIAFFPAKMHHQVLPFYTSDEYRISVSGNIKLDVKK